MSGTPWYMYPRIDNLGTPDPDGGFPKPDSNIQVPYGTSMTAPASGIITGIDTISPWGESITVKFDNPPNPQATHYVFLHLQSIDQSLSMGQHVSTGDELGVSGSNPQNAAPGFAFYPGDAYGTDTLFASFDTIDNLTGNGPFNPVPYLDNLFAQQQATTSQPVLGGGPSPTQLECQAVCSKLHAQGSDAYNTCMAQCGATPPVAVTNPVQSIGDFLALLKPWVSNPTRVIKLVVGIALVIGSIFILAQPESGLARTLSQGLAAPGAHIHKIGAL
jgi:hypothetical protein